MGGGARWLLHMPGCFLASHETLRKQEARFIIIWLVIPSILVTLGCDTPHKAGAQQCSPIKLRVLYVLKLFHILGQVPRLMRPGKQEAQEPGVGLEGSGR